MVDDPNEVVESSQTQYLHLIFTPPSHRIADVQRPQAATTPTSTLLRAQSRPGDEPSVLRATRSPSVGSSRGQADWHIPSSQGEISEPRTPRKRRRDLMDKSGVSLIHCSLVSLLISRLPICRLGLNVTHY